MMNLRTKTLLTGVLFLLGTGPLLAEDEGWTQDFTAAKKQAKAEGKDLFMDFTGSDWCGWCIRLHKEVFDHDEFKGPIHDDFILVKLDYPRDESLVTDEVREQNEVLKREYMIQGYPTIFLTDADGRPYARTGYQKGGAEVYMEHLAELRQVKHERDDLLAKAKAASGLDKAKLLDEALDLTSEFLFPFYRDTVDAVIALDADNEAGLKEKYTALIGAYEIELVCTDLMEEFSKLAQEGNWEEAGKAMEDAMAKKDLGGPVNHVALYLKGVAEFRSQAFDEARASIEKAKAADPEGRFSEIIPRLLEAIDQAKEQMNKEQEEGDDEEDPDEGGL